MVTFKNLQHGFVKKTLSYIIIICHFCEKDQPVFKVEIVYNYNIISKGVEMKFTRSVLKITFML